MSKICKTNHHRVKRVLAKNKIEVIKAKKVFTDEHKENISRACKGRVSWSKGKKMSKSSLYRNMASHLRFDIDCEWLTQFRDIEKLKVLNKLITCRSGRWNNDTEWYKEYIEKFYNDSKFNRIYKAWIESCKEFYRKPSIDHIVPKSNGGTNDIKNLQILTWFENRCKNDMSQNEWNKLKLNIKDYFSDE